MDQDEFAFQWHLTDRCNLRCRHCYQEEFTAASECTGEQLELITKHIFDALAQCRVRVNLTGGEPLLFPSLRQVIESLEESPSLVDYSIITNATVLAAESLNFLSRQKKLAYFKVSVESGRAEVNDSIRGPGNLERVAAGIRRLQDATGRPAVLMMTLARWNLEDIEQTVDFARDGGAAGLIVERFVPLGTGRQLTSMCLDAAGWTRAVETILRLGGLPYPAADMLGYHAFWLDFAAGLKGACCNLGSSMALMPDGTVFPCRRLPLPLGNARQEDFSALRRRLEEFSPTRMKKRLTGLLCSGCPLEDCAGCRALAAALGGSWLADDPRCPLRLEQ